MAQLSLQSFPAGISADTLTALLTEARQREHVLTAVIRRFEERYNSSLDELEARLARGEGQEHPDWEDSIEWRNAAEALQRAQLTRKLLEWLLRSIALSPSS
jgi:hypothetical protein